MKKIVVFYDISNDKIRAYISNMLLDKGLKRIQKSVFFGEISDATVEEIAAKSSEKIKEDTLVIMELCNACYKKVEKIGDVDDFEYPHFLYIK